MNWKKKNKLEQKLECKKKYKNDRTEKRRQDDKTFKKWHQ